MAALEGPFFGSAVPTRATLTDAGLVVASRRLELDTGEHMLSARVTAAGALDPAWGDGGIELYADDARAVGVFALPGDGGDGVLLVGSTLPEGGAPADLLQLRTDAAGAPDPGFGDGGRLRTDLGREGLDQFTVVAARPGGGLFVAGDTGDGIVAGRYDGAGEPDVDRPPAPLLPSRLVGAHVVRDATVAGTARPTCSCRRAARSCSTSSAGAAPVGTWSSSHPTAPSTRPSATAGWPTTRAPRSPTRSPGNPTAPCSWRTRSSTRPR